MIPASNPPIDVLGAEAVRLVQRWLAESAQLPVDASAERLAGVLKDERGLAFTLGFVDGVVRPDDLGVAARNLRQVARAIPRFLPGYLRLAIRFGAVASAVVPWLVVPVARRVLRAMVGHLVIDATPAKLDKSIAALRSDGVRLNINLLGEAVLGEQEADRRLDGIRRLLDRDDVDYVSIKVSAVASQLSMWAFEETVERVTERLLPLYRRAAASPVRKFLNLDMEEFRDLDLTMAVFTRILSVPDLADLEAGIVLQAYLPDSFAALQQLTRWAQARRAGGGAGIKIRIVKGANLAMEQVDAALHGWPLAPYGTKQETDTNYKRLLEWALRPEHTAAVRIGVAGHNLFDLAFAWLLAGSRGVRDAVQFEMLLGMATAQAAAVRNEVGGLLLYTPVVHPREFDVAISYLVRRLEENASPENFMSALFDLHSSPEAFDRERDRFLSSLAGLAGSGPASNRTQNRALAPGRSPSAAPFKNAPDTDIALPDNRAWARKILQRLPGSVRGEQTLAAARVQEEAELARLLRVAQQAGAAWGKRAGAERAAVLERAADAVEASRGQLLEVMAAETGKTLPEGDPEVSEAVDFARYYAGLARELDRVEGATFVPSRLTVVTPPWNFPVAIPAGSVLAALAAGSAVILKPAPQARRCAAVLVEALWSAGIDRGLLTLVDLEEQALGRQLIAAPEVDRVILTGGWETAALFRSWRPDLPLLAETSGKNAIIVTPSADLDLAAADVARSAFGHAGQKCSAASLVIVVGSVARSRRFRSQLLDAVRSLRVGYPTDADSAMGPLVEPATGKLLHALTTLGGGERWLLTPTPLDSTGRLWSPGIRDGVREGSYFHRTEFFGPVLGVVPARTLTEAIRIQNGVDYGLTAGLHSLDAREMSSWLDRVEAGNVYINRGITGAIVQRQPFGGWKRSSVGTGTKAGGPNYLIALGRWRGTPGNLPSTGTATGMPTDTGTGTGDAALIDPVRDLLSAAAGQLSAEDADFIERGAASDQREWEREFGTVRDVSGLEVELNLLRYRPASVTIRLAEGGSVSQLVRVAAAAIRAGAAGSLSCAGPLPASISDALVAAGLRVTEESDRQWQDGAARGAIDTPRVRLIGSGARELAQVLGGSPDIAIFAEEVTIAGRLELLPFLREQAVSITAHRFGNPSPLPGRILWRGNAPLLPIPQEQLISSGRRRPSQAHRGTPVQGPE